MRDSHEQQLIDILIGLQPRLRRFALGLTGSLDEADDLVQASYERALTRLHQWKAGTRADSWMYRIIQTVHLNRVNANRVRQRYASDVDLEIVPGTIAATPEVSADFADVHAHVAKLPEDQRTALLLVAVEGLSYAETAETLGVPIGTVTSRVARARAALVESLDERPKPRLVSNNKSA